MFYIVHLCSILQLCRFRRNSTQKKRIRGCFSKHDQLQLKWFDEINLKTNLLPSKLISQLPTTICGPQPLNGAFRIIELLLKWFLHRSHCPLSTLSIVHIVHGQHCLLSIVHIVYCPHCPWSTLSIVHCPHCLLSIVNFVHCPHCCPLSTLLPIVHIGLQWTTMYINVDKGQCEHWTMWTTASWTSPWRWRGRWSWTRSSKIITG